MAFENHKRLPLDALELKTMVAGHLRINLTKQIGWEAFPTYATALMDLLGAAKIGVAESVDFRLWDIQLDQAKLEPA